MVCGRDGADLDDTTKNSGRKRRVLSQSRGDGAGMAWGWEQAIGQTMFKCFSIREREMEVSSKREFLRARKRPSWNRCPFFAYLQPLWKRRGGRSAAWMAEAGLSWREIRCVGKGGFSGQG